MDNEKMEFRRYSNDELQEDNRNGSLIYIPSDKIDLEHKINTKHV